MKKFALVLALLAGTFFTQAAHAATSAIEVTNYTAGSGATYTNPSAALGLPSPQTGSGPFDGVTSPFNPAYSSTDLVQVGNGGSLTLRLENYAVVTSGMYEIGIFTNVGIIDDSWPNGQAGNPLSLLGIDSAYVEVSADGINFVALGTHTFNMFSNYWLDASDPYTNVNGSTAADFGKPYTGTVSDFTGMDYPQILTQLDGSAGGYWLDLDSSGLSQVGWIRFSGVTSGNTLEIDAVTVNSAVTGVATVPEPHTWLLLALAIIAFLPRKLRRFARTTSVAAALAFSSTSSLPAQLVTDFSDITYWVGSGSNSAALVIDWNDGHSTQSYVWGFHWDGTATTLDMLNSIATADSRFDWNEHPSIANTVYSIYFDADGDGGGYTFDNPVDLGGSESGSANDPDDLYREGWFTGYWNFSVNSPTSPGDNPYNGGDWEVSFVGINSQMLYDGIWNGFAYDSNFSFDDVPDIGTAVSAIPEPSAFCLTGLGVLALLMIAQRRKVHA